MKIEANWRIHLRKLKEEAKKAEAERQQKQAEFEAKKKAKIQAAEIKRLREEEEKRLQIELQQRIEEFLHSDGDVPSQLRADAETNPSKPLCTFFEKTAACKFGNQCLRNHIRPRISCILMMPRFFTNFHLEQQHYTEYGDSTLECNETDLFNNFKDFFDDVVPEFQKFGRISHFVVCHNSEPHLRGQVFVEYDSER